MKTIFGVQRFSIIFQIINFYFIVPLVFEPIAVLNGIVYFIGRRHRRN